MNPDAVNRWLAVIVVACVVALIAIALTGCASTGTPIDRENGGDDHNSAVRYGSASSLTVIECRPVRPGYNPATGESVPGEGCGRILR